MNRSHCHGSIAEPRASLLKPTLPLEIAKTATAACNKPDIRRFDALCVYEGKLKTTAVTRFYKRTCHTVISHDILRNACKTLS
jgi:hypothetical protein